MFLIEENRPLASLTTFNIGGPARYFCEVSKEEELSEAVEFMQDKGLPIFILGGGSNVLISDKGFNGLVILNRIKGINIGLDGTVVAGSGENWDDVVKECVRNGFAGIECMSGIPGSLGGAVVQNIGAYGQTFGDVMERVGVYDSETGELKEMDASECGFAYRTSVFKNNPVHIVTSLTFKLIPNGKPAIAYQDLIKYFNGKPGPNLKQVREAVLEIRDRKGMLIKSGGTSFKSAGSFFKNPVVSGEIFEKIYSFISTEEKSWFWPQPDGNVKLAAAKLLEEAGFKKGYCFGNVGIYHRHSLALVNLGGAKASEIAALSDKIKMKVHSTFGINLEEEVLRI